MRTFLVTTLLLLASTAHTLLAHEEFQILGKVTKISSNELEVKTQEGRTVSMGVGAQTAVLDNDKKSTLTQVKKGQSVVVTAFGDSYDDLGVLTVKIVKTLPKVPTRLTKAAK